MSGPLLFTIYASKLFEVVKRHLPDVYADDNQHTYTAYGDDKKLDISFKPGSSASELEAVTALQDCILHIKTWMTADKLRLNDDKTELVVIGTLAQLNNISISELSIDHVKVPKRGSPIGVLIARHGHVTLSFIHRHWLPIKFRINFKIAMLCFKCIHGHAPNYLKSMVAIKKTSTYNLHSSTSIQLEDRSRRSNKRLVIEPLSMHPPRFETVSRNHYSHSKILTPSRHCLKLTILEKGLIYNFFLVFHIVYILTFHCKIQNCK